MEIRMIGLGRMGANRTETVATGRSKDEESFADRLLAVMRQSSAATK